MRFIVWATLALGSVGCARGPNVVSSQLPLKRVVVYRNGVGYFERAGKVEDERVTFEMRQRLVGDFLASLAVIERGGSSVRSASFPLELEDTQKPSADEPVPEPAPSQNEKGPAPPPPTPPKKPDPNAMREVVLHLDGKEHDLSNRLPVGDARLAPVVSRGDRRGQQRRSAGVGHRAESVRRRLEQRLAVARGRRADRISIDARHAGVAAAPTSSPIRVKWSPSYPLG
ncbi:MAG: hypothetical protein QM756_32595 [Polyangiaceae bacterium]